MGFAIQHGFRLGDLEIYPGQNEIVGARGPVNLGPEAFGVLVAIAEAYPHGVEGPSLQKILAEAGRGTPENTPEILERAIADLNAILAPEIPAAQVVDERDGEFTLSVPVRDLDAVEDYAAGYDTYYYDEQASAERTRPEPEPQAAKPVGGGTGPPSGQDVIDRRTSGEPVGARRLRIFVSSPGDVRTERSIVHRVLDRLQEEVDGVATLEPVFWEEEPLLATGNFQAQIIRPSECDVMIAILWSRLGTPLSEDLARPDGTRYESGTEFEFEDAVQGYREHGRPQVLVYRRTASASVALDDERTLMERVSQKKKLDEFVNQWFRNSEDGSFVGAYHAYEKPEEFERLLEGHLRKLIHRMLPETRQCGRKSADADATGEEGGFVSRTIRDLRERRVFRVVFGYPVFAWVVLQVADVLANFIGMEARDFQPLLAVLIGGYPVAIFLAWLLQITRQGLVIHPSHKNAQGKVIPLRPLAGGLSAGVIAVGIGIWSYAFLQHSPIEDCDRTIAVLPFENFSPSPEDDYVGRGLAEEVLHLLTKIENLRVASRTASFSLNTTDLSMKDLGRRLGVCNILEGSVRKEGDQLRITAQLIDTETGYHEWSDTYDRQIADIFNVYDDIAQAVVRALKISFNENIESMFASPPTTSIDAYDRYLQGKSILARADDESRALRADRLFERALEFDADFARAWAGRCDANVMIYEFTRSPDYVSDAEAYCGEALDRDSSLTDVRVALARLLTLAGRQDEALEQLKTARAGDPDNSDVFRSFGMLYASEGELAAATNAYRRALELAPGDIRTYQELGTLYFDNGQHENSEKIFLDMIKVSGGSSAAFNGLGSALFMQGRFEEAAEAYRSAIANEPSSRTYTNAGSAYFYQGKFEDAAIMMREAVELSPDDYRLVGNLADALMRLPGHTEEATSLYGQAAELAEQVLAVNPGDVYAVSMVAHFYAEAGDSEAARAAIEKAEKLGPDQFYVHYFAGLSWLDMDRPDKALESLRKAVELGYPKNLLAADPQLEEISSSGEFQAIVAENGQAT